MFGEGQAGSGGLAWDRGDGSLGGGEEWRSEVWETGDKKSICVCYKSVPLERV